MAELIKVLASNAFGGQLTSHTNDQVIFIPTTLTMKYFIRSKKFQNCSTKHPNSSSRFGKTNGGLKEAVDSNASYSTLTESLQKY